MNRKTRTKSGYDSLEPRHLLAAFAYAENIFTLDTFAVDQVLEISQNDDGTTTLNLPNGDIWSGTDLQDVVTGSGTSTLTTDTTFLRENRFRIYEVTQNLDVVFETDFDIERTSISSSSITQAAGTAVTFESNNGLDANRIILTEPGNVFDGTRFSGGLIDVYSSSPITIGGAGFEPFGWARFVSEGDLVVGHDNFTSGFVAEDEVTLIAPNITINAARIGITGQLNLFGEESITIDSTNIGSGIDDDIIYPFQGNSRLDKLQFQSNGDVSISIVEIPTQFSIPTIGEVTLVGENTAKNLNMDVGYHNLSDAPGATLTVQENADVRAVHTIYLADNESNVVNIGGQAKFEAEPFVFAITGVPPQYYNDGVLHLDDAGDVRLGWFISESSTHVTVYEDDSSMITWIGDINSDSEISTDGVNYVSAGNMFVYQRGQIAANFWVSLTADGAIHSIADGSKTIKASNLNLVGQHITLDQLDVALLNFNSDGYVNLHADANMTLHGSNTANRVDLSATNGRLANIAGTSVEANFMAAYSDLSIWLASASESDNLSIAGWATFDAQEFVIIGQVGEARFGQLNFSSNFVNIAESDAMHLFGDINSWTVFISSTSYISNAEETHFKVNGYQEINAAIGIYLANHESDYLEFCGLTQFNASEFVIVNEIGFVEMFDWTVADEAFSFISFDDTCILGDDLG